ncbi:MAG TPA: type II CAAX endopeptidase family protein [Minicystis sp.]|nr:type II CAAX endopeptidase family protein [Minicystis sp.]
MSSDGPTPGDAAPGEAPPPLRAPMVRTSREALVACVSIPVATALVMAYAFAPARAGTPGMLAAIFGLDAAIAAVAIVRMHQGRELFTRMQLARGDIWLGGMVAGLLYGIAMLAHLVLTPHLTAREAWIMRLYLQIGDPRGNGSELVSGAVFVVAALEEVAWRGLVQRSLEDVLGPIRAVVVTAALFALAHAPTLWLLGDPTAGPNPLVVLAGFGCSLVWGALVLRTRRLVPSIVAHALFSWAIVEFPIWRP